jgi:hypothetical protein
VVVARIEIAEPRLLPGIARDQLGIEAGDLRLERQPFAAAIGIFGGAGLEASLVGVGAGIADVLVAVGLGEEQRQADSARGIRIGRIQPLGARDCPAEIHHVLEWRCRVLRAGRRRLHDLEQPLVFVDQRFVVGVEILRGNAELVGPADPRRLRVGQILVGAHQVVAREVKRLAGQVRQRLPRIDLAPALGKDRLELAESGIVGACLGGLRQRRRSHQEAAHRDGKQTDRQHRSLEHASHRHATVPHDSCGGIVHRRAGDWRGRDANRRRCPEAIAPGAGDGRSLGRCRAACYGPAKLVIASGKDAECAVDGC